MRFAWVGLAVLLMGSSIGRCDSAATTEPSADAKKLARDFETAIKIGDVDAAERIVDGEALVGQAERGIAASAGYAARFRKDAGSVVAKAAVTSLMTVITKGGNYKLIHMRRLPDKTVAIYRMREASGALDFFEWEIGASASEGLRFVDQYDMIKGDWTSHLLRKYYLAGVASEDKDNSTPLEGRQKEFVESIGTIEKLSKDAAAGKYEEAIADYKSLPADIKEDKACLVIRIMAADHLTTRGDSKGEYETAIADFEKYYPNDPAVDLLALDHWVTAKNYVRVHASVDRIGDFVGGDAYLDFLSGGLRIAEGTAEAIAKAPEDYKRGIELEPELKDNYWGLVTYYLGQKDYARTAAELSDIEDKLHIRIADLTTIPTYSGFVQSEEYKKWMADRAARK